MMKNDWLIDNLKLGFILDESLIIKESLIFNIFSFDINSIEVEKNEKELIELFFDEEKGFLYKIEYNLKSNLLLFTFCEKKLDYRSNVPFDEFYIEEIFKKTYNYFSDKILKSNISLSVYLQNVNIKKNTIVEVFKRNNFNIHLDDSLESFEITMLFNEKNGQLSFRNKKSFLYFDGENLGDKLSIKKLGKDQILFFKQGIVFENFANYEVLEVYKYMVNQISEI